MKSLHPFHINEWETFPSNEIQLNAVEALENGKILYFPELPFNIDAQELALLIPSITDPKSKNISYNIHNDQLGGTICQGNERQILKNMIRRYALTTRRFLELLIPIYNEKIIQGKTSLRTVEIEGRQTSYRKDDSRLHVDAFPSNPNKGKRILRVFTNINPQGKPRVWRTGEPFQDVVNNIAPRVSSPIYGLSSVLKLLGITKDYRTAYDHYMLKIHDAMKYDTAYQKNVPQEEVHFPSGTSWIVYTDQVSHAAMSGQHVLEQTFHLPLHGLKNQETAPLRILERYFQKTLV